MWSTYEVIINIYFVDFKWFYSLSFALVLFWFVLIQSHRRNRNIQEWISPGLIINVVEKALSFYLIDDHFLFETGFILYSYPPKGTNSWGKGGGGNCFSIYQSVG